MKIMETKGKPPVWIDFTSSPVWNDFSASSVRTDFQAIFWCHKSLFSFLLVGTMMSTTIFPFMLWYIQNELEVPNLVRWSEARYIEIPDHVRSLHQDFCKVWIPSTTCTCWVDPKNAFSNHHDAFMQLDSLRTSETHGDTPFFSESLQAAHER